MDKKERVAVIKVGDENVEFSLNSDNTLLLEPLTVDQWNKETKKMEKKEYYYLPIETIYELLEQLFPTYSITVQPMEVESKHVVKQSYYDRFKKTQVESEKECWLCRTGLNLTIDGRAIDGNARGVATIGQLTVDQMVNGLNQKMEARALKNACKKLGRVFRIVGRDEVDDIEKESITSDANVVDIKKVVQTITTEDKPTMDKVGEDLYTTKFTQLFEKLIEEKGINEVTTEELGAIGKEVRAIVGIEKGSEEDVILKKVYATYKKKFGL